MTFIDWLISKVLSVFLRMVGYFLKYLETHNATSCVFAHQPWCLCCQRVHQSKNVERIVPHTPNAGTPTRLALSYWTYSSWPLGWENWTWSTVHSIQRSFSSSWSLTSFSPLCCFSTCWLLWWGRRWDRCPRRARRFGSSRWQRSFPLDLNIRIQSVLMRKFSLTLQKWGHHVSLQTMTLAVWKFIHLHFKYLFGSSGLYS